MMIARPMVTGVRLNLWQYRYYIKQNTRYKAVGREYQKVLLELHCKAMGRR